MARLKTIAAMCAAAGLGACMAGSASDPEAARAGIARFEFFDYSGADEPLLQAGQVDGGYQNPVLAGFYPDPSVTRGEDAFYLVNSTFSWFPGIPVFRSTDLVNWTQIGNVIDRPGMLDFDGLGLSRGVFAPTIEYHEGTYYVANTCVECGGNFIVAAEDPAGPWSDPIWLPDVGGIDPSLFFQEDGTVWLMNNDGPPEGARYDGHRAIWLRQVDPENFQSISEPVVILNGGVRPEDKPVWIEGPHIYHVDGWYYLSAAEGGTAVNHSQVVLRSRTVDGPYTPHEDNPILTQRHLPEDRPHPITSVGHADLVQDGDGAWWATFLGVRPYEGDFYNTGRETFLMPVGWTDGWPAITSGDDEVPYRLDRRPAPLSGKAMEGLPMGGNFSVRVEFDAAPGPEWMTLRVPAEDWWSVADGALEIEARPVPIGAGLQPSFLGRRQQHKHAEAVTEVSFEPERAGDEAGLAVLQSDEYFYALGLAQTEGGHAIQLRRRAGPDAPVEGEVLASAALPASGPVQLRIRARGDAYDFAWRLAGANAWTDLATGQDGKLLSTRTAGGFVGAMFGLYAERAPG